MSINRVLTIGVVVVLSGTALASEFLLWNNGDFITHPNQGFGGHHASAIQSPGTTFGWSANANPFRMADDLSITASGLLLTKVLFYGYQTGTYPAPPASAPEVWIASGTTLPTTAPPDPAWTQLTGTVTSSFFPNFYDPNFGIFRVTSTTLTANTRQVLEYTLTLTTPYAVSPGTYWFAFSLGAPSSGYTGPWMNPTVPNTGASGTPNAHQWNGTSWVLVTDTGGGFNVELPYKVYAVPEPGTMLALGAGLALLLARRRRA